MTKETPPPFIFFQGADTKQEPGVESCTDITNEIAFGIFMQRLFKEVGGLYLIVITARFGLM